VKITTYDVCYGTVVEATTPLEAAQVAARKAIEDPKTSVLVGEHVGEIWGQRFSHVVRLSDGAVTTVRTVHSTLSQPTDDFIDGSEAKQVADEEER